MSFMFMGLSPELVNALGDHNFKEPMPIQKEAIPAILKGKDVLGIAKTGSGKTASYVLPILRGLQGQRKEKDRNIDVLVVVPTRELAVQVQEVFHEFANALPESIRTMAVHGGVSINPQMKALYGVNVLVATPGRLLELVDSNALSLAQVQTLVLDEADKMLNLGFKEEMNRIFSLVPKRRQNLLFSATLSPDLETINQVLLKDPVVIKIESEEEVVPQIEQIGYFVEEEKKGPLLRHLIKNEGLEQVLIFVSSVFRADRVAKKLRNNGIITEAIHGKRSQGARTAALKDFKEGRVKVLVATDLLARGIDIQELPVVINYELPRSPKDFIHRIGRTGRADAKGKAITFVAEEDKKHFRVIQKKMGQWVDMIDSDRIDF